MIRRVLAGHGYWISVAVLASATVWLGIFLLVNAVIPDLTRAGAPPAVVPATPASSGSSSQPPDVAAGMGGAVPANADCSACHLTDTGAIGLRPIPAMGHPLEGWTECTACHSTQTLVATAPGHTGIHATACLTCHKPGNLPAPLSRPHRDRQNMACLDCHGSTAPLPADMTHRTERVCWLCHRLPDTQPPIPAHATVSGETDCLKCHVGGKVGALPADHRARTASECLLCHDVGAPAVLPPASGLPGATLAPPVSGVPGASGSAVGQGRKVPLYALAAPQGTSSPAGS